ncbi:MAG: hypothetical protein OXC38_04290 [Gammaproteobacteria bacterium]|nr:hypothetical protein [Gammaproteobacteria bacterium]
MMLILYVAILLLIGGYILFNRQRDIGILLYILGAIAAGLAVIGFLDVI